MATPRPGERTSDRMTDEAQPGLSDWSSAGKGGSIFEGEGERPDTHEPTLWEHLQAQASSAGFTAADHGIALTLIDATDEGGYLRGELAEFADRLGVPLERIEAVLSVCHGFEPTGIMARSVPECLKLQLIERNRFDPAMAALLDNLDLLARRDLTALRRVCDVDGEDLAEMIAELKALTPRPGAGLRRRAGPDGRARRPCAARSGRRLAGGVERRHPAASPGGQALSWPWSRRAPAPTPKRLSSPIAPPRPTGWSSRWISGPRPY